MIWKYAGIAENESLPIIYLHYLLYSQVTLHLCYAHAGVAPLVQLLLHPAPALTRLRSQVTVDQI